MFYVPKRDGSHPGPRTLDDTHREPTLHCPRSASDAMVQRYSRLVGACSWSSDLQIARAAASLLPRRGRIRGPLCAGPSRSCPCRPARHERCLPVPFVRTTAPTAYSPSSRNSGLRTSGRKIAKSVPACSRRRHLRRRTQRRFAYKSSSRASRSASGSTGWRASSSFRVQRRTRAWWPSGCEPGERAGHALPLRLRAGGVVDRFARVAEADVVGQPSR